MKLNPISTLLICTLSVISSCVESIPSEELNFSDLIVVEALITDQSVRQEVLLSRTSSLNDSTTEKEAGAEVWIIDQDGMRIDFEEVSAGRYLSSSTYAAEVNGTLQLFFETLEGRAYESDLVTVQNTPPIDSVYAEFTPQATQNNIFGGIFNFYLDAQNNADLNRYYFWTWNSTFELTVRTPSRWILQNNEFINRDRGSPADSLQVEICWSTFSSNEILVDELQVPELGVRRLPITEFHSDTRFMVRGYSIEVKQYGLSQDTYSFWQQIQETSSNQGSLTDTQPGTIAGNIKSSTDPSEIVLGYFYAAEEQSIRRQFVPLDFLNEGYKAIRPNFEECPGVDSVTSAKTVEAVAEMLEELGDDWLLTYFVDAPPIAVFFPKKCADCTEYGSNKRPEFWE